MSIRFDELFEVAPLPVMVFHRETLKILYVNAAAVAKYGYSKEEFLAMTVFQIRPEEDSPWFQATLKTAQANSNLLYKPLASRHRRKDGTVIYIWINASNLDLGGEPVRLCFIEDMDVRHASDEGPSTVQEQQKQVTNSSMLGIVYTDAIGNIVDANDAFLSMIGYERNDLTGRRLNWMNITPPDYFSLEQRAAAELKEHGVCTPFEKEYWRRDGSRVPVMVGGTLLESSKGSGVYFVVDMSAAKRMEGELKKAVKSRDEFLSIASHELRTPMTPLQSLIQLLLKHARCDGMPNLADTLRMLESADHQVKRLVKLVNSLLDVSRIHTGKLQLDLAPASLPELVREVVQEMDQTLQEAGCRVVLDLDASAVGRWDALRLRQVVSNLLSNAAKYAPKTDVHLSVLRNGDRVGLRVRDFGPGIADDMKSKIFDRFERGGKFSGVSGFGLGLFISKEIIQTHGGTIRVESSPGEGAEFVVDLPC